MKSNIFSITRVFRLLSGIFAFAAGVSAEQTPLERERAFVEAANSQSSYTIFFVFLGLATGAIYFWWRRKRNGVDSEFDYANRVRDRSISQDFDNDGVDAEKELEWFRKARKSPGKSEIRTRDRERTNSKVRLSEMAGEQDADLENQTRLFQEKMRKAQFSQLPIHSFLQLTAARPFEQLPISSDPAVLSAIEQTNEEYEEDEAVRELAVRILARFKHRNSVEALTQVALYDLSSVIRSRAVAILTEFDHESVFEPILLACADPTREARAAAARGLFRLSFDRAEAFKRIIATNDEFRMSHAARAAIESGIVTKSLDRLLHDDMRIAYEAFALVGLLIKSGEMEPIFDAIRNHKDERIKLALLHVIKVVRDEKSLEMLDTFARGNVLAEGIRDAVVETVRAANVGTAVHK